MKKVYVMLAVAMVVGTLHMTTSSTALAGRPPRAPQDGYVYFFQKAEIKLIYQPALRVYVVDGHPNAYYYNGIFYRIEDGRWESSRNWKAAKWKKAKRGSLPPGLAKRMG